MVAIAVILATLAVREITAVTRRGRHREAVTNLGELFNATAAYFHERRPSYSGDPDEAPHRCPHPQGSFEGGATGMTPSLDVRCSDASDGACTPGDGEGAGVYPLTVWTNNPMWISLGFVPTAAHRYHYEIVTHNSNPDGYGVCTFTVIVRGDDPSDPCNEFRREGTATAEGVVAGPLQACPDALGR